MVAIRVGKPASCGRWLRVGCIVLALGLLATTVRAADPEVSARELQVVRTLLASLTSERPAEPELVVRKLIERGETVVPALLVAGRKFRQTDHQGAIIAVLRRLDGSALRTYLLEYVAKQEEGRATNAAWLQLAEAADGASIPSVLAIMDGNPWFLKSTAERALTRILLRNDRYETWALVEKQLASLSEETRMRVAMCVGGTDSALGLDLLAKLLGRWANVDHALVAAISQMPEAGRGEEVVRRLRPYLNSRNREIRRETITALAVFADVESAAALIESLAGDDGGIRGNAHWALTQLSGLKFPESPERWKLWHTDETAWWEAEGAGLLDVLISGTDLQILEALRTIAGHRLYRMKFSPLLRKLLEHPSPEVRDAAEETLVQLGLMEGEKTPEAMVALAANGFESITPEEYQRMRAARADPAPEQRSTGSFLVPILGMVALLALFGRIFGRSIVGGLGRLWGGGDTRRGPIVLTIDREREPEAPRQQKTRV